MPSSGQGKTEKEDFLVFHDDGMGNPCRNVEITEIKNESGQRETVCITKLLAREKSQALKNT